MISFTVNCCTTKFPLPRLPIPLIMVISLGVNSSSASSNNLALYMYSYKTLHSMLFLCGSMAPCIQCNIPLSRCGNSAELKNAFRLVKLSYGRPLKIPLNDGGDLKVTSSNFTWKAVNLNLFCLSQDDH